MVPYPYFVDVRGGGLNQENPITASLPQITVSWGSPIVFTPPETGAVNMTPLFESSQESWTDGSGNVQPDFKAYPKLGFEPSGAREARILAAVFEGTFASFFKGKASPLLEQQAQEESAAEGGEKEAGEGDAEPVVSSTIEKSPESARIILLASNEFLADQTLAISRAAGGDRFLNSLDLAENAVDWALEDRALLTIRSRGHFSRTLRPATEAEKAFWEYANYGVMLVGLFLVYGAHRAHARSSRRRYRSQLSA